MPKSIVSVIVPTKNSSATLDDCLASVKDQSYNRNLIEIVVVDNFSTDTTPQIAQKYTKHFFSKGPERSAQRNYAVSKSRGEYVLIIDSDMKLSKHVIEQCVQAMENEQTVTGVIIPEESFGEGFWAQCKKLERSFYVGVPYMEAARFFKKTDYAHLGGYDTQMVSGEDWDLSQRIEKLGKLSRIDSFIYHNEGRISLVKTIKKKYYYAKKFSNYTQNSKSNANLSSQTNVFKRYHLFLSEPIRLFRNPLLGAGMLFMKTCEFIVGGLGYILSKRI